MYVKRNHDYRKKFYFNLSGLTLKAEGSSLRKYEITDVREGSVAAMAGLQTGDIIIAINGMPARELELSTVNAYFNSKPGKKVTVEIERAGKPIKKVFHLENQV
jgi:C-terminal processing protease CtpA/Prc